MSKRGLYSTLSKNESDKKTELMMNFISLCDGENSLLEIAERLNLPIWDLYGVVEKLKTHKLLVDNN